MATVDELLAGVSTVDKTLVISNDFRTINIPSSVPNLGVENDDDVLRLDFKMPRYVSDTDLSTFSIRINYINSQGETDAYTVSNALIGSQYITFSWLVGPTATRYKGNTKFIVCAKTALADGTVDKEFNTTIATLPVLEGLEVDEAIVTDYSDIIEQWRRELFGIGDTEEASIKAVSEAEQAAIENKGTEVLATIPADYQTAVSMTDNADRTKSDAIVCSQRGEIIVATDSSDDYLRGLKVFGKTTQVTTTGKNLLNVDEHLSFTGLREKTVHIPAGTYILTWSSRTSTGQNKPVIRFVNNSVLIDLLADSGNSKVTLTKDETTLYIYSNGYDYSASENVTATITQLMLSVDGGAYEPYSGGLASPSPTWPQPLTNIKNPTINIYGKNLLKLVASNQTTNGVTFTINADDSISIKGTATASVYYGLNYNVMTLIPGETYTMTGGLAGSSGTTYRLYAQTIDGKKFYADYGNGVSFKATDEQWQVLFAVYKGTTVDFTIYPELHLGSVTNPVFEPYMDQSNITIPYSLSAVPVDQNGNRIDLTGQQWICDEIDFERGVYIQRTKTIEFNGTENWYISAAQYSEGTRFDVNIPNIPPALIQNVVCDRFVYKGPNAGVETVWVLQDTAGFRVITTQATTPEEFQQFLSNNHTTVIYAINEPVERKLTAAEIEWFRFAHTNFPTTTVVNDAGATMELEYNADTKLWLDNVPKVTDEQAGPLVEAWMNEHFADAEGVVYGKSAYEIAVERGFQGSEEYWLASLKGRDGKDGKNGEPGAPGVDGADGRTPEAGKDYYTDAEKDELTEHVTENVVDTLKSGDSITIDDHVIEQGRNDTWTWRKWASGVAEVWGKFTKDNARSSPVLPFNMVNYGLENWPDPIINYAVHTSALETDIPAIACCLTCSNNFTEEGDVVSWDVPDFVYINPLTNERFDDAVWSLNVHMLGRWKPLE